MKYALNTLSGRLKALADDHTLSIVVSSGNTVRVNKHTLGGFSWAVDDETLPCTLTPQKIGVEEFDRACERIGFEGIARDALKEELFSC